MSEVMLSLTDDPEVQDRPSEFILIGLSSKAGEGTTVTITIPYGAEAPVGSKPPPPVM